MRWKRDSFRGHRSLDAGDDDDDLHFAQHPMETSCRADSGLQGGRATAIKFHGDTEPPWAHPVVFVESDIDILAEQAKYQNHSRRREASS